MNISFIRQEYIKHSLNWEDAGDEPLQLFSVWLHEAIGLKVEEPTAMGLSTVSKEGRPSSRMVLLKGIEEGRLLFFSNYDSYKGRQISVNPYGSLLFFWPELERQVRIEGIIKKISTIESDKYFDSRPLESRVGAIASPQSKIIDGREELDRLILKVAGTAVNEELKRPAYWGGYALTPDSVEFWQGRPGRLHDRIRFRQNDHDWIKERLAP